MNGRLDTIQAAVLLEKLKIFPDEIAARQEIAERYTRGLHNVAVTPAIARDSTSVWAQYTLRFPNGERDAVAAHLKEHGIPTAIYYAKPLHRQPAYKAFPVAEGGLPVTERLAREVLSLPMHPYLDARVQDFIVREVRSGAGA
jgi:dTDP-4-amino-4,6-dideoxygalactose transaminase